MPASTCAALLQASSFSSCSASFSRINVLWSRNDTPRGLMRFSALHHGSSSSSSNNKRAGIVGVTEQAASWAASV
jgi:hypothetical protein